jgi:hypothetical protein
MILHVKPRTIFRPYGHPGLDRLAAELDPIFDRILPAPDR